PPAAIVADLQALVWLRDHPRLKAFILAHYLPRWRELWLPGLSARLTPEARGAAWLVPADGRYRIFAAPLLAEHPWFRGGGQVDVTLPAAPQVIGAMLRWSVNGRAVEASSGFLQLRRNDRLLVVAAMSQPIGIFVIPGDARRLFQHPPPGVTLDSLALRTTRLP